MNIKDVNANLTKQIQDCGVSVAADISEVGIDSIMEEGILRDIPIVGTVRAIIGTGLAIRERRFLKNVLLMLQAVKNNERDSATYKEFFAKYNNEDKYRSRVNETFLLFCDKNENDQKAKIAGAVTEGLMRGLINYDDYVSILFSLYLLNISAIGEFEKICRLGYERAREANNDMLEKETQLLSSGLGVQVSDWSAEIRISPIGRKLSRIIFDEVDQ